MTPDHKPVRSEFACETSVRLPRWLQDTLEGIGSAVKISLRQRCGLQKPHVGWRPLSLVCHSHL